MKKTPKRMVLLAGIALSATLAVSASAQAAGASANPGPAKDAGQCQQTG